MKRNDYQSPLCDIVLIVAEGAVMTASVYNDVEEMSPVEGSWGTLGY